MESPDRKITGFEMAVYDAVRMIPFGKVASYATIAAMAGRGTGRNVGTALARCPFGTEVPCHRVVRSDGSVGGFSGGLAGPGVRKKERMLRDEKVPFIAPGSIDPAAFFNGE